MRAIVNDGLRPSAFYGPPMSLAMAIQEVKSGAAWSRYDNLGSMSPADFENALRSASSETRTGTQGKVTVLSPMKREAAKPNTLSKLHGEGAFPAHVDGAHFKAPPRFIVLFYARNPGQRSTPLYDWSTIIAILGDPPSLYSEPFYYRTGQRSFIDTILTTQRRFVRYDPGCMVPATASAATILKRIGEIVAESPPILPPAQPGTGLVIDNWRLLHGRAEGSMKDGDRLLYRGWLGE